MQSESHGDHDTAMTDPKMAAFMEKDMRNRFLRSLLLTFPIIAYSAIFTDFLGVKLPAPISHNWLLFLLTTPVVFKFGSIFITGAYQALKNKTLNMMVLIATGVLAAYIFSVIITLFVGGETFFDAAAMLVTFVLFGHWMEMKSRRGTSDALRALFDLVPPQARVLRDGKEVLVPTAEVQIGDLIILKPGDQVPVDGEITEGETAINESLVTGESLPVNKKPGDEVIGGSINQSGSVIFKATKVGSDTALAHIVQLVETAQNSKAPGQRIADKAAQYLVVLAIGSGLITFGAWYFLAGESLFMALMFAVSAIVIACPDALGLATPTAVAVGTGLGAKHNILIKDAATLEQASKIQVVVLDKTGTLTEGKPTVKGFELTENVDQLLEKITVKRPPKTAACDYINGVILSIEEKSHHPLAEAIVQYLHEQKASKYPVEKLTDVAGKGIQAEVDGHTVLIGTQKFMEEGSVIHCADLDTLADTWKGQAWSVSYIAIDQHQVALIGIVDSVKPSAAATVAALQRLQITPVMMTGDNKQTAQAIAKQVGISEVLAEVLPQDKAGYIKKLQDEGKFVAMVGDGVNDAPALAQADIGIAIGAGTDVAIETANIVLMRSDVVDVLRAIKLSKATVRKMKENLAWASVYNVLAIPIAAGVFYPSFGITLRPEFAALLMSLSSIIVSINAVLLKRIEKQLLTI
ncbi:MAG: copper-translocating P-type ATPase [Candidatus Pacebacteria bacterium RIFCSPHIGHO2_02_FULL_46_9]|nr:MAG: copper-translocating P-type ATPase [Candidatus Pacebacteria bacterium RIFCSPHIGHO2_02_FULL_46_9]